MSDPHAVPYGDPEAARRLTEDIGRELYGLIVPLGTWSREWGKCLQPEE